MKISKFSWFLAASILSTVSCTSLSHKSDRDPASIAEACGDKTISIDPTKLTSQVFFQLEQQSPENFEAEFQRLNLMVTKSGLYSSGLTDSVDPRLVLIRRARGSSPVWNERYYSLVPSDRPSPTDEQVQGKAGDLIRLGRVQEARRLLTQLSLRKTAPADLRMSARLDLLRSYRFQGSDDQFLEQLEKNRGWYQRIFDHTPAATKQYSNFKQALIRGHVKKEKFDQALQEINELRLF